MNGRINTKPRFFLLLLSLIFGGQTPVFSDELRDGNVLIAEIRGEVNFRSQNGSPVKAEDFKPGSLLPVGYQVLTGKNSSVLCLLSNGTLFTVRENSDMRVESFRQEPFVSNEENNIISIESNIVAIYKPFNEKYYKPEKVLL